MRFLPLSIALIACRNTAEKTEPTVVGNAPVAEAGSGGVFSSDQPIPLDGSSSYDPDGDEITFHWSFQRVPEGSSLLDNTEVFQGNGGSTATTSFFADTSGTYIVDLVVIDSNELSSNTDSVILTVEEGQLPIADAGIDQETLEGATITLNGTASSDPLGRDLSYQWSISSQPRNSVSATLSDATVASPSFTPDAAGMYLISLVVNNGINDSTPDSMVVEVSSVNPLAPTADAGPDIEGVEDCTPIQLSASASSDPNGDPLEYNWSLQSKPEDSEATNADLSDPSAENPSFYADVAGEYIFSLAVFDGALWSVPDLLTVTAGERATNSPPTAIAGSNIVHDAGTGECELSGYNYNCTACTPVTLTIGDLAQVSDGNNDPLTYSWNVLSGDATISDPESLETTATFSGATPTEPNACEDTVYELELVVEDCPGAGVNDIIEVTMTCCGVEVIQ